MKRTVALMQPYFFPYLGYFELLAQSDVFVFYDDAAFSKNGWYNRNRVLSATDGWQYFRISLRKAPLGTPCCKIELHDKWEDFKRILNVLSFYSNAPNYRVGIDLVEQVFADSSHSLSDVASRSVLYASRYLGIETEIKWSSQLAYDRSGVSQEKILDICRLFGATTYLNAPGGRRLYTEGDFLASKINLRFCSGGPFLYNQPLKPREANLSVIDAIMWCEPDEIRAMVQGSAK